MFQYLIHFLSHLCIVALRLVFVLLQMLLLRYTRFFVVTFFNFLDISRFDKAVKSLPIA